MRNRTSVDTGVLVTGTRGRLLPVLGVLGRSSVTAGLKGGCRVPGVSRHPLRVCCEAEGGLGALAGHAVFLSSFGVLRGLRQSSTRAGPVWSLVLPWGLWHLPG